MSDTVRFATVNDTVTPANSGGFNGFPFPTPATGSTGTGTINPLQCTLAQAVKFWWRVKNWSFSSSCTVVGSMGTPNSFPTGNMTPLAGSPTTELDLINTGITHEWSIGTASSNQFVFLYNASAINDGTSVWPSLPYNGTVLNDLDAGGGANVYLFFDKAEDPAGGPIKGPMAGTIDGIACDLYYDDSAVVAAGGTFTPGSWTMTPVEYWPYAQLSDGLAVYDTSTGAVITGRSPLN